MPGESGVTVVTMLVWFYFFPREAAGASRHPAFPAPSEFSEGSTLSKLARIAQRDRGGVGGLSASSLRGVQRRSNPAFLPVPRMDCFASARNDGMGSALQLSAVMAGKREA